ncbi:General secretion pathway protein B [Psychromonas ingrahamii 37]|uniref:General secretion pathway protein B n=1 Tax=Psychromonas ingrahamii (strain DSM 17664 / CCUG 51855 / 37) TaxID=357804 RepID=A1SRD1_PSYIN|nr:general secretion pathway protein GspB [Psychromonas ingrahamii]ABM02046.1 General secretion pathway protein B [Psychromonas ingrahamii 37]
MSTILAALQKQKSSPGAHFIQQPEVEKGLFKWRVTLLISLLVIISLLSVLLYLQLNGETNGIKIKQSIVLDKVVDVLEVDSDIMEVDSNIIKVDSDIIEVTPPAVNEVPIKIIKKAPKAVKEMTFVTQPLPEVEKPEPPIKLVPDESTTDAANLTSELDYSAVSNELQQRFEFALADSKKQNKLSPIELSHDGRDLYEMAGNFQQKVPSIRYDTHIYSSIVEERWIKINGNKLKEGQFDPQGKIQLLEIQPNRSIFRLDRQSFSLESLTDWKVNR